MKLGRVLYRHAANKHPVAIGKSNKVGSHSLLCLWCCSQVLEMLQVEREPELSAFGLRAAHSSELLPLHVAHLGAFYRAPHGSVAVNSAFARNAHVLSFAGANQRRAFLVLHTILHLEVLRTVGSSHQYGILLQMQVDVVLQRDKSRKPYSLGHHKMSATLIVERLDGFCKGLGIESQSIAYPTEILDINTVIRDFRSQWLHHLHRQVLIILSIICSNSRRKANDHHHSKNN